MLDGKKSLARSIVYNALAKLKERVKELEETKYQEQLILAEFRDRVKELEEYLEKTFNVYETNQIMTNPEDLIAIKKLLTNKQ